MDGGMPRSYERTCFCCGLGSGDGCCTSDRFFQKSLLNMAFTGLGIIYNIFHILVEAKSNAYGFASTKV